MVKKITTRAGPAVEKTTKRHLVKSSGLGELSMRPRPCLASSLGSSFIGNAAPRINHVPQYDARRAPILSNDDHCLWDIAGLGTARWNTPLGNYFPRFKQAQAKHQTELPREFQASASIQKKKSASIKLRDIRRQEQAPKFLPLSQITALASTMKLLDDKNRFNQEYFDYLALAMEINPDLQAILREENDTRDKKLEDLIQAQTANIHDAVRELISNGIDATSSMENPKVDIEQTKTGIKISDNGCGMSPEVIFKHLLIPAISSKTGKQQIGRFGVGFFTALKYLKTAEDSVKVLTNDGSSSHILVFQRRPEFHNAIGVSIQEVSGDVPRGTSVEIDSPYASHASSSIQEKVLAFQHSQKAEIYYKHHEKSELINPKPQCKTLEVETKHGKVELLMKSERKSTPSRCVDGVLINYAFNDCIINYPNACNLSLSRDSIAYDSIFEEVNKRLIDAVCASDDIDTKSKIYIMDLLAHVYKEYGNLAQALLSYLKEQFHSKLDLSNYYFLSDDCERLFYFYEVPENIISLINPHLLEVDTNPLLIPEFEELELEAQGPNYKNKNFIVCPYPPKQDSNYHFWTCGDFPYIFIRKDIYDKHKYNPAIMNVYASNLDPSNSELSDEELIARFKIGGLTKQPKPASGDAHSSLNNLFDLLVDVYPAEEDRQLALKIGFPYWTAAQNKSLKIYLENNPNCLQQINLESEKKFLIAILTVASKQLSDDNFNRVLPWIFDFATLKKKDLGPLRDLLFTNTNINKFFDATSSVRYIHEQTNIFFTLGHLISLGTQLTKEINPDLDIDKTLAYLMMKYKSGCLNDVLNLDYEQAQEILAELKISNTANFSLITSLERREYPVTMKLSDLIITKNLRWSAIQNSSNYKLSDLAKFISETSSNKDPEEYQRTVHHLINSQMVNNPWAWLKECVQNSLDALCSAKQQGEAINIQTQHSLYQGQNVLATTIQDPVGMDRSEILNYLLIPNETTKGSGEFLGKFGQGFFTIFNGATEVLVKSSKGNGKVNYLRIIPIDINGNKTEDSTQIADFEILCDEKDEIFQGTEITQIRRSIIPELEIEELRESIRKQVCMVKPSQAKLSLSTAETKINRSTSSQPNPPEPLNTNAPRTTISVPPYGDIDISWGISGLYKQGLLVSHDCFITLEFLGLRFLEFLLPSFALNLPHTVALDKSRTDVLEAGDLRDALTAPLRQACLDHLLKSINNGSCDISQLRLSYDFFDKPQTENPEYKALAEKLARKEKLTDDENKLFTNHYGSILSYFPKAIEYDGRSYSFHELAEYFQQNYKNFDIWRISNPHLQQIMTKAFRQLKDRERQIAADPSIEINPIGFNISVEELTDEQKSQVPLLLALDDIRKLLLKHMGANDIQARYYYSNDKALGRAYQSGNEIYWNLKKLTELLARLQNAIQGECSETQNLQLLEEMISLETHERVHTLENYNDQTHDYYFFDQQRKILKQMLIAGPIDWQAKLKELAAEFPEAANQNINSIQELFNQPD